MITSNPVFFQWDKISNDPLTTAAAIDRPTHYCTILELTGPSYRAGYALNQTYDKNIKKDDSSVRRGSGRLQEAGYGPSNMHKDNCRRCTEVVDIGHTIRKSDWDFLDPSVGAFLKALFAETDEKAPETRSERF